MVYFKVTIRKVSTVLVALIAAVALSHGCSTKKVEQPPAGEGSKSAMKELDKIETADPGQALQEAIKRGDLRFVGIRGYTVEVPGVNEHDERIQTQGVRIIEGTTDALTSDLVAKFQEKARAYAEAYNRLLLDYLKNKKP